APVYLACALAAALLALAARGRLRAAGVAVGLAGVAASAVLVVPEAIRNAGPTAPAGAPGSIKVIQFNVWQGNRRLDEVEAWLVAQRPDVVILEETGPALRDRLVKRTGWQGVMGYRSTTMIITPPPYVTMNRPDIDARSKLTFVNATYAHSAGPYEVVATHLDWPGPQQSLEHAALRGVIGRLPTDRMILAGDFNSSPWSFALRRDDHDFGLVRRDRAFWSWPADLGSWRFKAPFPFLPIDHLYAGPGWATVSVERGPHLGSDHYPLIVTLAPVSLAGRYPGSPAR
ncbi:MAG: endonuclease/exonuclease/phosphatase family protein, partial [Proteobacteria bacterium]|nr:endonuclease/exonuclease/phosphatase family protein [Pseudomonadota bacterium]